MVTSSRTFTWPTLLATLLTTGLITCAGCAPDGTKAGAQAAPVTLRIATDDFPGRVSADQITHFAEEVQRRSDGGLRVEPIWRAAGADADNWDQVVAGRAISGEVEMALVPSRAWDTEGVLTMRALSAPFLATSPALVNEVVGGDLATRMLAGLEGTGVHGLALFPEGMRYVFSFGAAMSEPDDFDKALLRVPESATSNALFTALGATASDRVAGDSGETSGAESSFALIASLGRDSTMVVGNEPLWPKVNSLVVNQAFFAGLSTEQQEVLSESAAATRAWAIQTREPESAPAQRYCQAGGTVVVADADDVAAMRHAARPVYVQLEEDPATAELIAAIEDLAEQTGARPESISACEPSGEAPDMGAPQEQLTAPGRSGALPQGNYRYELTAEDLRSAGLPEADVSLNTGVWTWTLQDGTWTYVTSRTEAGTFLGSCAGFYDVVGDRASFTTSTKVAGGHCAPPTWVSTWSAAENGNLFWSGSHLGDFGPIWSVHPWVRVSEN